MPVSSCFRTPFATKRVHGCQIHLEPTLHQFYPNFQLIQDKVSWKYLLQSDPKSWVSFEHVHCRLHIFSSQMGEITATGSNAIISKMEDVFCNLFFIFWNLHKILLILKKKDQLYGLNISNVIDPDKCGSFKCL